MEVFLKSAENKKFRSKERTQRKTLVVAGKAPGREDLGAQTEMEGSAP